MEALILHSLLAFSVTKQGDKARNRKRIKMDDATYVSSVLALIGDIMATATQFIIHLGSKHNEGIEIKY